MKISAVQIASVLQFTNILGNILILFLVSVYINVVGFIWIRMSIKV